MEHPPSLYETLCISADFWTGERGAWDSPRIDDSFSQILEAHEQLHRLSSKTGYRPTDFTTFWNELSAQWRLEHDKEAVRKIVDDHSTGKYTSHDLLSIEVFNCSKCHLFIRNFFKPDGILMVCLRAKEKTED